jgi:hypothetical protein
VEEVGATLVVVQAAGLPVAVLAGVVRAVVVRVAGTLVAAAQAGVEALVAAAQAGVEALVAAAQAGVEALVAAHLAVATPVVGVVRAVGYLNAAAAATNVTPETKAATRRGLAVVAVVGGETPAVARTVVVKMDEINRALFAVVVIPHAVAVPDKHPPNEALLPFATAAQLS